LQRLRAPEPLHGPFSSSKRLVRVLGAIVEPTSNLMAIDVADFSHRRGIGPQPVSDDVPPDDKTSEVKGAYNEVAGSAQSAWGSAKDAAKEMTDTGSIPDLSRLRDDIAKLTQTVSDLAQKQVASSRDQMASAVGAARDSLSQSAAVAQDKFAAVEGAVEARIKKNPWGAVAVAGLIGC
jgi:ElaB/YqjD/DUF883 family membrane-anchored ribosome-binding protein